MAPETSRKLKALLIIAMLAVTECRRVENDLDVAGQTSGKESDKVIPGAVTVMTSPVLAFNLGSGGRAPPLHSTAASHQPALGGMAAARWPRPWQRVAEMAMQSVSNDSAASGEASAQMFEGAEQDTDAQPLKLKARPKKAKNKSKVKTPKSKIKGPPTAGGVALVPEQTFFEGPPSSTEMIIPGASILTVVGIIPFSAAVARQAWTRYKITDRRIEVASGFQGKDVVQVAYREVIDIKWLRRYGGAAGDMVLTLKDGAKLEMRSVPEFDRNLAYMMEMLGPDMQTDCGYPDGPARKFLAKVESGEEPPIALPTSENETQA